MWAAVELFDEEEEDVDRGEGVVRARERNIASEKFAEFSLETFRT